MKNLPLEFQERMKKLLSDEYADFIKAYDEKPVRAFRVNTDKISLEDFEKMYEKYSPLLASRYDDLTQPIEEVTAHIEKKDNYEYVLKLHTKAKPQTIILG